MFSCTNIAKFSKNHRLYDRKYHKSKKNDYLCNQVSAIRGDTTLPRQELLSPSEGVGMQQKRKTKLRYENNSVSIRYYQLWTKKQKGNKSRMSSWSISPTAYQVRQLRSHLNRLQSKTLSRIWILILCLMLFLLYAGALSHFMTIKTPRPCLMF